MIRCLLSFGKVYDKMIWKNTRILGYQSKDPPHLVMFTGEGGTMYKRAENQSEARGMLGSVLGLNPIAQG